MIKILYINVTYRNASTGRIIQDIVEESLIENFEYKVFFQLGDNEDTYGVRFENRIENFIRRCIHKFWGNVDWVTVKATKRLIRMIKKYNPDLIHLHTLHHQCTNYRMLFEFLKEYGKPIVYSIHDCWVYTGGCVLVGDDKVIHRQIIPEEDVQALFRYWEKEGEFPCAFVLEHKIWMNYTDKAVDEIFCMLNFPAPPICPLEQIKGQAVSQIIAFFTEEKEKHIMEILPHCESTRWNPLFTDLVPLGISKRVGIDKMLEYFRINLDECMAFGDGGNDIQMLSHAGIGIAMGNASDEVKKVADFVTDSVDEDGVYKALKHFKVI